jgi:tetratricopeptide (TPR) repeat protein
VTSDEPIDAAQFLGSVKPLLEAQDLHGLTSLLKNQYTHAQITSLFKHPDSDTRKVAALTFGLIGKKCCLKKLAPLLKDSDPMVNQMAEHSMWSVWFRSGSREANCELKCGMKALDRRDFTKALEHLDKAIVQDPEFAEPYNQRAIVHYMSEQIGASIEDCRRTVERMPCHFGAWAGLGHCHAHEGRLSESMECYERALSINPHLEGIRQAVEEIRLRLKGD